MKVLMVHSEGFQYEALEAARGVKPEPIDKKQVKIDGQVLVAFITVESKDEKNQKTILAESIEGIASLARDLGETNIVVYPWAHLSGDLSSPTTAQNLVKDLAKGLSKEGFQVHKAAFGWYKSFQIHCLGHSRAETLRSFEGAITQVEEVEEHPESTSYVYTPENQLIELEIRKKGEKTTISPKGKFSFDQHRDLQAFIRYETVKDRTEQADPPHLTYMRRHELASSDSSSDPGNLRWYPRGRLIRMLLERYAYQKVSEFGALPIETPVMYSQEIPAVREQVQRFPARQYRVYSGKKELFLRYASDFGMFFMMSGVPMTYRNLPLRVYELVKYAFRREKAGETVGLRRLRAFTMPDLHTFCYDLDTAKDEFEKQYDLSLDSIRGFNLPFEAAFRTTRQFFKENRKWFQSMVKKVGKPILLEIFEDRHFYWILKFEFNVVDAVNKAAALSTVQIDVETAQRYGITYVDQDGKKKHPIILHTSHTGAIERVLYAILETAARNQRQGKPPMYPLWLAPSQVRLIPIQDQHIEFCEKLKKEFENAEIRCDLDDRDETTKRKIRTAEREWVPYIIVVGDEELKNKTLPIRDRSKKSAVKKMDLKKIITEIQEKIRTFPFVQLPAQYQYLSKRPIFIESQ
ncbi:MAG: threonine--tRNA ligase [Candidatus Ranarchaeia archaeon]|jgi:threonyl-tRNA synthetase